MTAKPTKKALLSARKVRERYSDISDMTLWRWQHDEKLGFPPPIYINGRRYWDPDGLDTFDSTIATTRAA